MRRTGHSARVTGHDWRSAMVFRPLINIFAATAAEGASDRLPAGFNQIASVWGSVQVAEGLEGGGID